MARDLLWRLDWIALLALTRPTRASLPWGPITISPESLRPSSQQISFDPLALLAVLHNPRAAASAARLYNQPHAEVFRWRHTMMIGGALVPFKVLVDHLVSQRVSIHPSLDMCEADLGRLEVKTDMPGRFTELPISGSNLWLSNVLNFKPSKSPQNDILIVHVTNIRGKGRKDPASPPRLECLLRDVFAFSIGLLLLACTVLSILDADVWSTTLFAFYFFHWLTSAAISQLEMVRLVEVNDSRDFSDRIRVDKTRRHAIYARPEGGKVVFVGHQDMLESWARMQYVYTHAPIKDIAHWLWIISGSLGSAASVICMVNMAAWFQLAFLGILVISSLSELELTIFLRRVQHNAINYGVVHYGPGRCFTWSMAIIKAAQGVPEPHALKSLDWIALGLLPKYKVFEKLARDDETADGRAQILVAGRVGVGAHDWRGRGAASTGRAPGGRSCTSRARASRTAEHQSASGRHGGRSCARGSRGRT